MAGGRCLADHRPQRGISLVVAPFDYAGTGGRLVRRFKLDAAAGAGQLLARAMRQTWRAAVGSEWRRARLVAVPLHRGRRAARGFEQAEWLARCLASRLELVHLPRALARTRETLAQGDPRTLSRERNVAGAFEIRRPVRGRRVVLVDDVFTSGATMRECAAVLRRAGVREIAGLVACRS